MKKIIITASGFKPFMKGVLQYFKDIKYFFKPEFKTERYDHHFYKSYFLTLPVLATFAYFLGLKDTNLFFIMFIGWFDSFAVNFVRENLKMNEKTGVKYSQTDVNFGSYGGTLAGLTIYLINLFIR